MIQLNSRLMGQQFQSKKPWGFASLPIRDEEALGLFGYNAVRAPIGEGTWHEAKSSEAASGQDEGQSAQDTITVFQTTCSPMPRFRAGSRRRVQPAWRARPCRVPDRLQMISKPARAISAREAGADLLRPRQLVTSADESDA